MTLTGKQKLFAEAVLAGQSNKDAAIAAGCSERTASAAGSRMAKHPAIAAFIACRRAEQAKTPAPAGDPAPTPQPAAPDGKPFDMKAILLYSDPMDFLQAAMNDVELDYKLRVDSAKALMPFKHNKLGEGGKKDQAKDAAKTIAEGGGKFGAARPPPRLVSNNK